MKNMAREQKGRQIRKHKLLIKGSAITNYTSNIFWFESAQWLFNTSGCGISIFLSSSAAQVRFDYFFVSSPASISPCCLSSDSMTGKMANAGDEWQIDPRSPQTGSITEKIKRTKNKADRFVMGKINCIALMD